MSDTDFEGRMVTQTITAEYLHHLIGVGDDEESLELVGEAVQWFERNYNAVAEVRVKDTYGDLNAIQIRAIASLDADTREIQRGVKDIQHYLQENHAD